MPLHGQAGVQRAVRRKMLSHIALALGDTGGACIAAIRRLHRRMTRGVARRGRATRAIVRRGEGGLRLAQGIATLPHAPDARPTFRP